MTDTATEPLEAALSTFPGIQAGDAVEFDGWPGRWAVTLQFEDSRAGRHAREFLAYFATEVGPVEFRQASAMPVPEEPGRQSYHTLGADHYTDPEDMAAWLREFYRMAYEATPEAVCDAVETA